MSGVPASLIKAMSLPNLISFINELVLLFSENL